MKRSLRIILKSIIAITGIALILYIFHLLLMLTVHERTYQCVAERGLITSLGSEIGNFMRECASFPTLSWSRRAALMMQQFPMVGAVKLYRDAEGISHCIATGKAPLAQVDSDRILVEDGALIDRAYFVAEATAQLPNIDGTLCPAHYLLTAVQELAPVFVHNYAQTGKLLIRDVHTVEMRLNDYPWLLIRADAYSLRDRTKIASAIAAAHDAQLNMPRSKRADIAWCADIRFDDQIIITKEG